MPLSLLRKLSGLSGSNPGSSGPATTEASPCKDERKKSPQRRRSLLDAFTWRSTKSSMQSSKSDESLESANDEKPTSLGDRPDGSSGSFPCLGDQSSCKIISIELTKRQLETGNGWRKHRRLNMAIRFSESNTKVELRIDCKWTIEEIRTLVGIVYEFRHNVEEAVVDAPICELLVATIADINLDKWYAFQCYIKALSAADLHLTGVRSAKPNEIYWPHLKRLIVNTTAEQAPHLSRLLDYGVADDRLVDRQQLELVHINLMHSDPVEDDKGRVMTKINKDINSFRCWAGSAGFDERFHVGPYTVA